ncbi:cell wall metabolism sensor histidine kinase WalK [Chryseobacterium oryzae]|uniref:Cell wall metabolism sensor histidine kinase WalK n=1 Tax=Chryseobacterium oryzae TaxID=2929799 RepID=A0ABY4BG15_9FLAO|nr:cell wall metabolism sensor histidine kinase WalK [Chryseobacterium oryzae]UOE37679.1 cell wall metabolism sensor histidine kinase WalK [Chryseobacterium oryzae]
MKKNKNMISYNEFFKTNNLNVKAETLEVLLDPKYLIFFDNLENKESLILDLNDQSKLLLINILISVLIRGN